MRAVAILFLLIAALAAFTDADNSHRRRGDVSPVGEVPREAAPGPPLPPRGIRLARPVGQRRSEPSTPPISPQPILAPSGSLNETDEVPSGIEIVEDQVVVAPTSSGASNLVRRDRSPQPSTSGASSSPKAKRAKRSSGSN